jgi:MFS family permease
VNDVAAESIGPRALTGLRGKLAVMVMLSDAALLALVFTALPPALPAIAQHFGGGQDGAFIAQMVMTMPSIGLMLGGVFSGFVVDRIGARTTLLIALTIVAVTGSAGLYVDGAPLLLGSRLLLGFAAVTVGTATGYMIGVFIDPVKRTRILGYRNAFGSFFGLIGAYSAGPVTEFVGWRSSFAIYFVVAALIFVTAIAVIPATPPQSQQARAAEPKASLLSLMPILPFYILVIPFAVLTMINGAQLSFLMTADGVTSAVVQSWIIGLGSVFSATASLLYPPIRNRLGNFGTFALIPACLGGGTLIVGLTDNLWIQAVGSSVTGFGCGVLIPYFYNIVYERTPRESLGRGIGFMFAAIFLGDFLNPVVLGSVTYAVGGDLHAMFIVVGATILSVAAIPIFMGLRQSLRQKPRGPAPNPA